MRPIFDGFPYLVTRIGRTPLRHIALLPADRTRSALVDLARRQALANRLDTCLCLGPSDAVYVTADGVASSGTELPWGVPITDALALPERFEATPELAARRAELRAFVDRHRGEGYLVGDGLEGGRPATAEDVERLSGRDAEGVPRGLERCLACGRFRGEHLALEGEGNGEERPRVLTVHCRCQNHNRCARCGAGLAESRLSAYSYDEAEGRVVYCAAYCGLGHPC